MLMSILVTQLDTARRCLRSVPFNEDPMNWMYRSSGQQFGAVEASNGPCADDVDGNNSMGL